MEEIPPDFRPCASCSQACYKEHWPFRNRDSFRPPCFVKALCDSNLAAMATCWMVIPSAWLKLYGDDVGNSAILLGPSGNKWQVGVSRPKWVAFRVGWRTFAADNCLEKGDMLVFTLIGKSKFSVKIFDSRTCLEKESSLTATNTGCYDSRSPVLFGEKRKLRDGCVENANIPDMKRICFKDSHERACSGSTDNTQAVSELVRQAAQGLQPPCPSLSIFASSLAAPQRNFSVLDLMSQPLSAHQMGSDGHGARSFPRINQQLMDALDGGSLHDFASGVVYQPHPISARAHDPDDECKTQECISGGGVGPATRFAAQRRPVMDTTRDRNSEYQCRQNSSSALVASGPSSHPLDMNKEDFVEVVGPNILSPATILERGKVLELARRAQDTIDRPSHLVVLRAFHVHGRAFVRFPVTFGKQHMPRKTAPMHLLDSKGHRWPMTWLRDNETHMGLTRGWRDFCLAQGLSEGDVCIFELVEFNKLTLLIHVFRSTESRDNTQVIITKSKRLDSSHPRHPSQKMAFERRKILEEGIGQRREVSLDDNYRQPSTSEGVYSTKPIDLIFYNGCHKSAHPKSVSPNKAYRRHGYPSTGSVGRMRLNKLALSWDSQSNKDKKCLNSTTYGQESTSHEGQTMKKCKEDDVELIDADMSKAQDTAYGEILCQMSSGCRNVDTNSEEALANSRPTTTCMSLIRNNYGILHSSRKREFEGPNSCVLNGGRDCGLTLMSKRHDYRQNTILGRDNHKQLASIWKQCRKAEKMKTLDRTNSGLGSSLKRKMQALNRFSRFYFASKRSFVTKEQREATKESALALITKNPTALVVMKNSNVYNTHKVELPPSFASKLSSSESSNIFLNDAAGHKTWKARLAHNTITKGWRQFSLEHLLEEGDICVFELINVSQLAVLVHIFRVVDVDHFTSYRNHYRLISQGMLGRSVNKSRKTYSNSQVVKEISTARSCQSQRESVARSLYLSLQKTKAKHEVVMRNKWSHSKEPLDLNLDVDHPEFSQPVSISGNHLNDIVLETSHPEENNIAKLVSKTTSPILQQQIVSGEGQEIDTHLATDNDNSETEEEENYYRVVRILEKRYFRNEKQYLTELDGPVIKSSSCEGIRDHDDMKWWIPEKSFSLGFASCYLR